VFHFHTREIVKEEVGQLRSYPNLNFFVDELGELLTVSDEAVNGFAVAIEGREHHGGHAMTILRVNVAGVAIMRTISSASPL